MSGLTPAKWSKTLFKATSMCPKKNHMSLYDLQVERGTVFGKWYGDNDAEDGSGSLLDVLPTRKAADGNSTAMLSSFRPALPLSEDCAFMYSYASGYLHSRNYEH